MLGKRCVSELGFETPFLCYHIFNLVLLQMAVYERQSNFCQAEIEREREEHQLNFSITAFVSLIFGKMMLHLE